MTGRRGIDSADLGQLLRGAFGGIGRDTALDAAAERADAALAVDAAGRALHPLMFAGIARLYGAANAARLDAAVAAAREEQDPHGAGDELLYEYDPAEQARFEAACAREDAGWPDD